MDPLRRDDIDRVRRTPLEIRAAQALEAMRLGIRLRRVALRERHPDASDSEIAELVHQWLLRGE